MRHVNSQLDVAACLDAHRNFRAFGADTFCNIYAAAFLALRGLVIPVTKSANQLYDWFDGPEGRAAGWFPATLSEAIAIANADGDVVAISKGEKHGHIAVCVESLPNTPGRLCVSAAGANNFIRAPIERSFGDLPRSYFVNLPTKGV